VYHFAHIALHPQSTYYIATLYHSSESLGLRVDDVKLAASGYGLLGDPEPTPAMSGYLPKRRIWTPAADLTQDYDSWLSRLLCVKARPSGAHVPCRTGRVTSVDNFWAFAPAHAMPCVTIIIHKGSRLA
jgi:hypothetical protein